MRSLFGFTALALALAVSFSASAGQYKIDPVHSSSHFKVLHFGASYIYGTLPTVTGEIEFDPATPEASKATVVVKTAGVTTQNEGRDRHLSGPDFFNAKEFPEMRFTTSSWKKTGERMFEVSGTLSLLGKKQTVTAVVEFVGTGKHARSGKSLAGFHAEFTIDRSAFGMSYGVSEDGTGLGKDVDIIVSVEAAGE